MSNGTSESHRPSLDPREMVTPEGIWTALTGDPTTGVAIIDIGGTILWLNQRAAKLFYGPDATAPELVGKSWRNQNDPRWVSERTDVLAKVRETGKPVMLRMIWRGRQQVSWIQLIQGGSDGEGAPADHADDGPTDGLPDRFLVITRRVGGDWEAEATPGTDVEMVESELVELGALDVLTARELEVLALIGQGMSLKEIAATLHRSYKTIENHRGSIGRKLHMDDRVKLAEIAQRAGLTLADAERERIDPPQT